jgi:hypothetical protein
MPPEHRLQLLRDRLSGKVLTSNELLKWIIVALWLKYSKAAAG